MKTSAEGLAQQHAIAMKCYDGVSKARIALNQLRNLRSQLKELLARAGQSAVADGIAALEKKASALEGIGGGRGFGGQGRGEPSLSRLGGELLGLMELVEGADVAPNLKRSLVGGFAATVGGADGSMEPDKGRRCENAERAASEGEPPGSGS